MLKNVFILILFLFNLNIYCQIDLPTKKEKVTFPISNYTFTFIDNNKKEPIKSINLIDLFFDKKNNTIITLKGTDFFNELLLKKLTAYV